MISWISRLGKHRSDLDIPARIRRLVVLIACLVYIVCLWKEAASVEQPAVLYRAVIVVVLAVVGKILGGIERVRPGAPSCIKDIYAKKAIVSFNDV